MIEFKQASHAGPMVKGSWRRFGRAAVVICCQGCGFVARLPHEVAADGTVTPSVVCPKPCGFHDMVKLEGWQLPS